MSNRTDINDIRIRCGRKFVFGYNHFTFNCNLCLNVYETSDDFGLHMRDHFPQLPNISVLEDVKPEIKDEIVQEVCTDEHVTN